MSSTTTLIPSTSIRWISSYARYVLPMPRLPTQDDGSAGVGDPGHRFEDASFRVPYAELAGGDLDEVPPERGLAFGCHERFSDLVEDGFLPDPRLDQTTLGQSWVDVRAARDLDFVELSAF